MKKLTILSVLLTIMILNASAVWGACTLISVDAPQAGEYIGGPNYPFTVSVNPGDTCADDGVTLTGFYLYDSDGDGDFTDEGPYQSFKSVSPAINSNSYYLTWDTLPRTESDNTRYKSRVVLTGGSGNTLDPLGAFGIDNTEPVIASATTNDDDKDGVVDQIIVTFTETGAGMDTCEAAGWTVTDNDGADAGVTVDSCTVDSGTQVTLGVTPTTPTDFYSDNTPQVAYVQGTHDNVDGAGNEVASGTIADATDGAAPVPVSAVYQDNNADAQVETLVMTMSETVQTYTFDTADWLVDTAGTINLAGTTADTTAYPSLTITLTVTADADVTGGTTEPQIHYNDNDAANQITDANAVAQTASTSVITLTDGAAPRIVQTDIGGVTGTNKNMIVTFTEPVTSDNAGAQADLDAADFDWNDASLNGATAVASLNEADGSDTEVTIVTDAAFVNTDVTTPDQIGSTLNSLYDLATNAMNDAAWYNVEDNTPMNISQITEYDVDGDGNIDELLVEFTEPVNDATVAKADAGQFTLGGTACVNVDILTDAAGLASANPGDPDTANDQYITIFTDDSTVIGTDVKAVVFTTAAGKYKDLGGQDLDSVADPTEVDAAPAVITAVQTLSDDKLQFTFSEAVNDGADDAAAGDARYDEDGDGNADDASFGSVDATNAATGILVFTVSGTEWATDATGASAGIGTDEDGNPAGAIPMYSLSGFNGADGLAVRAFTDNVCAATEDLSTPTVTAIDRASPVPISAIITMLLRLMVQ